MEGNQSICCYRGTTNWAGSTYQIRLGFDRKDCLRKDKVLLTRILENSESLAVPIAFILGGQPSTMTPIATIRAVIKGRQSKSLHQTIVQKSARSIRIWIDPIQCLVLRRGRICKDCRGIARLNQCNHRLSFQGSWSSIWSWVWSWVWNQVWNQVWS